MTDNNAQSILAGAQEGRFVIEDFTPLTDSLEWSLGQQFWRDQGSKAFSSDSAPVPYVINNDGDLSRRAAELLFSSLVEAENKGALEPRIFVLELGIGVGLFARFFLDAFKEICSRHGKDFYRRLQYIAGDRSERMLADTCRNGIFANHPGRYLLRVMDAIKPGEILQEDPVVAGNGARPLRAVFTNYVLDCLPVAHLRLERDEFQQLCVRTCLARNIHLPEFTPLSPQEIARRARDLTASNERTLKDLVGLFASEYDYQPMPGGGVPFLDFALKFTKEHGKHLLFNYGAIQSLQSLVELLQIGGFILINDYGVAKLDKDKDVGFEHQRFSQSTSVGLNFPLLKAFFSETDRCRWYEPKEDDGNIYARLIGHKIGADTIHLFTERFSKAGYEHLQEPVNLAHANLQHGRIEAALAAYHKALERQPCNWILMNEVAMFLIYTLRSPAAGIRMAKAAIDLNPNCSSELWNTLGDAWYEVGKVAEAKGAYQRALRINPSDIRGRYNLAWVLNHERRYKQALAVIAEALALDETGTYAERLMKKQNEVLTRLEMRNQQRYLLQANRVSNRATADLGKTDQGPGPSNNGPSPTR